MGGGGKDGETFPVSHAGNGNKDSNILLFKEIPDSSTMAK
jgi:hypothetical protein